MRYRELKILINALSEKGLDDHIYFIDRKGNERPVKGYDLLMDTRGWVLTETKKKCGA